MLILLRKQNKTKSLPNTVKIRRSVCDRRPGFVYGPGNEESAAGWDWLFRHFLHLGGSNTIPFTYVDNCAEAISSRISKGVDGEVFNVVDDESPSSREVSHIIQEERAQLHFALRSGPLSYFLCLALGKIFAMAGRTIAPHVQSFDVVQLLEETRYTNAKAKNRLGWDA